MKKILWISRHFPNKKEFEELKRIFGEFQLFQYAEKVKDADHVLQLMKQYEADEIVTILPLSIIMRLCEKGIKPLFPECKQVDEGYDFIDEGSGKKYKFIRFVRVKGVILDVEPLS